VRGQHVKLVLPKVNFFKELAIAYSTQRLLRTGNRLGSRSVVDAVNKTHLDQWRNPKNGNN